MYAIGEKIIYGEQGACVVSEVGHVAMQGIAKDRLFYTLRPVSGAGTIGDTGSTLLICLI